MSSTWLRTGLKLVDRDHLETLPALWCWGWKASPEEGGGPVHIVRWVQRVRGPHLCPCPSDSSWGDHSSSQHLSQGHLKKEACRVHSGKCAQCETMGVWGFFYWQHLKLPLQKGPDWLWIPWVEPCLSPGLLQSPFLPWQRRLKLLLAVPDSPLLCLEGAKWKPWLEGGSTLWEVRSHPVSPHHTARLAASTAVSILIPLLSGGLGAERRKSGFAKRRALALGGYRGSKRRRRYNCLDVVMLIACRNHGRTMKIIMPMPWKLINQKIMRGNTPWKVFHTKKKCKCWGNS